MKLTLSSALAAFLTISPSLSAQPAALVVRTAASPAQPAMQDAPAPRRIRLSGGIMAKQLVTHVDPIYPAEAKASATSGTVVLHVIVGTDGAVHDAAVVSGPEVFQRAAIDAVKQWTYKPFVVNDEPAEVDTTVTVNFSLNPEPQPQP